MSDDVEAMLEVGDEWCDGGRKVSEVDYSGQGSGTRACIYIGVKKVHREKEKGERRNYCQQTSPSRKL